jgi:pantoate--beta-alanine ligase
MRTIRTVAQLRDHLRLERSADRTLGLVPTMGAFHAGHRALMERARRACDVVVVSLFVNPTQFGAGEDLAAYPRDEGRDAAIAAEAGVDVLFAPSVEAVYPPGFQTTVRVSGLSEPLEGVQRPGHFDGVATVVTKLLNMVGPDVAYFGQKDAQQALVVRRLVRDLDIPVRIEVCPTVREPDGLALSSRNAYLDPAERERAVALRRALDAAESAVAAGERDAAAVQAAARAAMAAYDVEPEYLALVSAETLAPVARVEDEVLVAVAARVGAARLIDNTLLTTNHHHHHGNGNGNGNGSP